MKMKNKAIWIGGLIGAILAMPFFIGLFLLEEGAFNNKDGVCPYHKEEIQSYPSFSDSQKEQKTVCENREVRGIPEGKITGTGSTCINGIYYKTNYHCITKNIGLFTEQSGCGNWLIGFWWMFLMEFYGITIGILVGALICFIIKKLK